MLFQQMYNSNKVTVPFILMWRHCEFRPNLNVFLITRFRWMSRLGTLGRVREAVLPYLIVFPAASIVL